MSKDDNIDLLTLKEAAKKTGLWQFKITRGKNKDIIELWLILVVCRIFRRFYLNKHNENVL